MQRVALTMILTSRNLVMVLMMMVLRRVLEKGYAKSTCGFVSKCDRDSKCVGLDGGAWWFTTLLRRYGCDAGKKVTLI